MIYVKEHDNYVDTFRWDRTGFRLAQKRLEQERWPWPENEAAVQELTVRQTEMLLEGIDFWKAHKELHYTSVY